MQKKVVFPLLYGNDVYTPHVNTSLSMQKSKINLFYALNSFEQKIKSISAK